MYDPNLRYKLAASAQHALQKLRSNSSTQLIKENTGFMKSEASRMIFEEYDDTSMEQKVKIDSIFYKTMLSKIQESYTNDVRQVLTNLFTTVQQIYEHVNIKPRVYGFNLTTALNDNDKVLEENAKRMINDFVQTNYYALTQEQREEKYFPSVRALAKQTIISEQVDEDTALKFATKAEVMKEMITRISFPLPIRNKIEEDLVDESYKEIFDQERLSKLWEQFKDQVLDVSKIVATVI